MLIKYYICVIESIYIASVKDILILKDIYN